MAAIGVTGAAGFVGSHLLSVLSKAGHRAISIRGDIAEPGVVLERLDAVIHAAGVHGGASTASLVRNNSMGTGRIVELAKVCGATTFIYLSSISVYGEVGGSVVDETTPIHNPNAYGMTKWLGELMVRESAIPRSLSIRPCGVIGPGSSRNWLSCVLAQARAGQEIALSNPDARFNNAVWAPDLCQFAIDAIANSNWSGHDAVTIAADGMTTVQQAVGLILEATGRRSAFRVRSERTRAFTVSSERATALYGYRPMAIEPMLRQFAADSTA